MGPCNKKRLSNYIAFANYTKIFDQVSTLLGILPRSWKKPGQEGRTKAEASLA